MIEETLLTLEFRAITARLANYAKTPNGRLFCEQLAPSSDFTDVKNDNQMTDEVIRLIAQQGEYSREGFGDIEASIHHALKGSQLSVAEGFLIAQHLVGVQSLIAYRGRFVWTPYRLLTPLFMNLNPLITLHRRLQEVYAADGTISDSATSTLHRIRRHIRQLNAEIDETMNHYLRNQSSIMAESFITTRQNRLVLPLKTSHKNALSGVVLGTSDSGLTSYVLPEAIAQKYSKLEQLQAEEVQEIDTIMSDLTVLVAANGDPLLTNHQLVIRLDVLAAKAALARFYKAVIVETIDHSGIHLLNARHPLIDPQKVVANSYLLDDHSHFILITGPNTGGKTVSLKTVGLLVIMHQSGLACPVSEGSKLAVFENVYVDIGDAQSIASSLSTFSSHLKRLVTIIEQANDHSLVLIDEIGAGTDPAEGEGIAVALFETLAAKSSYVMASTHYSNLKKYAKESKYIRIASMSFDETNFIPTYHYLPDIPGKSYAFEISQHLGLPSSMIERARSFRLSVASNEQLRMDQLEIAERTLQAQASELAAAELRIARVQTEVDELKQQLNTRLAVIDTEIDQQVDEAVQLALNEIESIVTSIQGKSTDALKMHEWIAAKQDIKRIKRTRQSPLEVTNEASYVIGDYVRIKSLNQRGPITSVSATQATVSLGLFTVDVPFSDLDRHVQPTPKQISKVTMGLRQAPKHIPLEINLVGKRIDEAEPLLQRYLEDAVLVNHKQVRIIHGHGTGALRNYVHETLKQSRLVKDFRLGGSGEGGVGATVVTFK